MTFLAEQYSGFFRRSVAALQSRPEGDALEQLHRLIEAPLTRERVTQLVEAGIAQATRQAQGAVESSVLGNLIGRTLRLSLIHI